MRQLAGHKKALLAKKPLDSKNPSPYTSAGIKHCLLKQTVGIRSQSIVGMGGRQTRCRILEWQRAGCKENGMASGFGWKARIRHLYPSGGLCDYVPQLMAPTGFQYLTTRLSFRKSRKGRSHRNDGENWREHRGIQIVKGC
jgi:hypothetical protein